MQPLCDRVKIKVVQKQKSPASDRFRLYYVQQDALDGIPAIFYRHLGTWQGTIIKINAQGERQNTFSGSFAVSFQGGDYHQENIYHFADGTCRTLRFTGQFKAGILILSSSDYPEFQASAWDAGNDLILFSSSKKEAGNHFRYIEVMSLISPSSRVRSTQIFKDGCFDGMTYIEETRQIG